MESIKAGIIGCGNISGTYLRNLRDYDVLEVTACADLDLDRTEAKAEEFGVPKACSPEELLSDPEIQLVINLTIPGAHADICLAALERGKHVYVEKPLAASPEEGRKILEAAEARGLRVGGAPDTFLGGGLQTCRKLIDDGWIGEPVAATASMMSHGHESWHPDPDFFYQPGGGPMFDMGPYYLTALVNLIGPVRRVSGSARATFPERTITSRQKYGQPITVRTPTHIAGVLDFENGAIATLVTSFDVWHHRVPHIEIYGTEGTLGVPDPNNFGGPVLLRRQGASDWAEIPLTHGLTDNERGIGVADMAAAILEGRRHRAEGNLAFHVLELLQSFFDASADGRRVELDSTCDRPAPLPSGFSKVNLHQGVKA